MSIVPTDSIDRTLLPSLFLTNSVPTTALQADPRVSYAAYIPEPHYYPDTDSPSKLPLLITIHGTHRDHLRYLDVWKPFAERERCAILAPLFPAMLQGPLDIMGYHYLGRGDAGGAKGKSFKEKLLSGQVSVPNVKQSAKDVRHDLCLLVMLDEVALRWPGIDTSKVFLTGFSGGAQFVHRFLFLHPERLHAAAVAGLGEMTTLDASKPWPEGVEDVVDVFGKAVDFEILRSVPVLAAVGGDDGVSMGTQLRKAVMGKEDGGKKSALTRLEQMEMLAKGWREEGMLVEEVVVPGVAHEMAKVHPAIEDFMTRKLQLWWEGKKS